MIIFLNGVSSSGKSTIAKALQHVWETPLLHVGIDTFFNMLPVKYVGYGEHADQGFAFTKIKSGEVRIETGVYGKKLCNTMIETIKLLSDYEHNLVVDEVVLSKERMEQYKITLKNYSVYYIGVHVELNDLLEREILRGDRPIGSAKEQLDRVHHLPYDLEVNTTKDSPFTCARKILNFITNNKL